MPLKWCYVAGTREKRGESRPKESFLRVLLEMWDRGNLEIWMLGFEIPMVDGVSRVKSANSDDTGRCSIQRDGWMDLVDLA